MSARNTLLRLTFALILLELNTASALPYNYDDTSIVDVGATRADTEPQRLRLWLTISARHRYLEVSWKNAPAHADDHIFITTEEPHKFERIELKTGTHLAAFNDAEGSGFVPNDGITERSTSAPTRFIRARKDDYAHMNTSNALEGSGAPDSFTDAPRTATTRAPRHYWISNDGTKDIVAALQPSGAAKWFTTGVPFDFQLSRNVTAKTGCYGYWASYVNGNGTILASTCMRAYPRWMREMRTMVGALRLRDLFIPGTHDSGSYRPRFDPLLHETIVTKYSLTQDDDVRGQLLHGARYLDIRVGYYRNTVHKFYINHGVARQQPLAEIIEQVKEFVLDTNEIVIFGLKEFPVGFGKDLGVHRLLVSYLQQHFGDVIVHPSATWRASLNDIWSRQQNVILAYDNGAVVAEHPHTLFGSVEQRWGNVVKWTKLEQFLRSINTFDVSRLSSRPVADMAELTPDTWGVILDKYGGLRKMADQTNWRISELYRDELGTNANIVAVDFIRGTSLMEIALDLNKRRVTDY